MGKRVIHVSEIEAASDLASLLARVQAGAEVIIERDSLPVAVIRTADPHVRRLSASLSLVKKHGSRATLDGGFARDIEEVVASHREALNPPTWD